ncbi:hypothetical protein I6A81_40865, partial [Frankia sp. CN7]|nr:hypothetical protein [Frankia nepalensis]
MRPLLVRTSVLDQLCGPLVAAVAADPAGGDRLVAELADGGLLAAPLPLGWPRPGHEPADAPSPVPAGGWYRYHQLLRATLRETLRRDPTEDEAELNLRAALWYAADRRLVDAARHARRAGDWRYLACLVTRGAVPLVLQGDLPDLAALLADYPDAAAGFGPECATVAALARVLAGDTATAGEHLSLARSGIGPTAATVPSGSGTGSARAGLAADAAAGRRTLLAALEAVELRRAELVGDADASLAAVRRALRPRAVAPHGPAAGLPDALRPLALCARGRAELWRGRLDAAEDALRVALAEARRARLGGGEISCLGALALGYALRGRLRQAEETATAALACAGVRAGSGAPRWSATPVGEAPVGEAWRPIREVGDLGGRRSGGSDGRPGRSAVGEARGPAREARGARGAVAPAGVGALAAPAAALGLVAPGAREPGAVDPGGTDPGAVDPDSLDLAVLGLGDTGLGDGLGEVRGPGAAPSAPGAVEALLALAVVAGYRGDPARGLGWVDLAGRAAGVGQAGRLPDLVSVLRAWLRLGRRTPEDLRAARRALAAVGAGDHPALLVVVREATQADLLVAAGNPDAALRALGRGEAASRRDWPAVSLARGRAQLAQGDAAAAALAVAPLLRADAGGLVSVVAACAISAVAAARRGDGAQAGGLLARAFALAQDEPLVRPFADLGPEVVALIDAHPGLSDAAPDLVVALRAAVGADAPRREPRGGAEADDRRELAARENARPVTVPSARRAPLPAGHAAPERSGGRAAQWPSRDERPARSGDGEAPEHAGAPAPPGGACRGRRPRTPPRAAGPPPPRR